MVVTESILLLQLQNIDGPYRFVLNTEKWNELYRMNGSYQLIDQFKEMVDGPIVLNKNTKDSMPVLEMSDDFILTLGKDISMGYEHKDQENLRLYLLESFSIMVIEPGTVVVFI
jgi:uncharacterized linocin/CFP29 family protein